MNRFVYASNYPSVLWFTLKSNRWFPRHWSVLYKLLFIYEIRFTSQRRKVYTLSRILLILLYIIWLVFHRLANRLKIVQFYKEVKTFFKNNLQVLIGDRCCIIIIVKFLNVNINLIQTSNLISRHSWLKLKRLKFIQNNNKHFIALRVGITI